MISSGGTYRSDHPIPAAMNSLMEEVRDKDGGLLTDSGSERAYFWHVAQPRRRSEAQGTEVAWYYGLGLEVSPVSPHEWHVRSTDGEGWTGPKAKPFTDISEVRTAVDEARARYGFPALSNCQPLPPAKPSEP